METTTRFYIADRLCLAGNKRIIDNKKRQSYDCRS